VVLTGANDDGARGLATLRERGGYAIVQDPADAEVAQMPQAALDRAGADAVLPLDEIAPALVALVNGGGR
jgi:two-component system chemotaxis response regulator CheB